MSSYKSSAEQIETLTRKLQEAADERSSIEAENARSQQLLVQFINRLSLLSQGIGDELDARLAKTRQLLQRRASPTELANVLDDINQLAQHWESLQQQQLRDAHQVIKTANKQLTTQTASRAERDHVRQLLNDIESPNASVSKLLPPLVKLLDFYQRSSNLEVADTKPNESNPDVDGMREELINLLSVVDVSGSAANALQRVRQHLIGHCNAQQLLSYCMQIIRLVVQSISDERKSAQSFLAELNDAIVAVNDVVQGSAQHNKTSQLKRQQSSQVLQTQVDHISSKVANADSLAVLKTDVQAHLLELAAAVTERRRIDAEDYQFLQRQCKLLEQELVQVEAQTERYKQKLAEQKFKSLQDALTRLPNRTAFEERLELEYKRWQRHGSALTIAVADIDHFKRINDNYGHIAGDKTLQVIANMLRKALRGSDFVCRYGGEEFVIIFPQSELTEVKESLDKARQRIKQIPFKFRNEDISISISIGAASFHHSDDTPLSVFERADKALYEAKKSGRDVVILDQPS